MSVFTARYDLGIYCIIECYINDAKRQLYLFLTHLQRCPLYTICFFRRPAQPASIFHSVMHFTARLVSASFLPWYYFENKRQPPDQIWRASTVRVGRVRSVPTTKIQVSPMFRRIVVSLSSGSESEEGAASPYI
jgi:hypothetical protein